MAAALVVSPVVTYSELTRPVSSPVTGSTSGVVCTYCNNISMVTAVYTMNNSLGVTGTSPSAGRGLFMGCMLGLIDVVSRLLLAVCSRGRELEEL